MSISPQLCASRRVHFDASITKSPCNGPNVIRNPINDDYYLRMVFAEKKMWIKSNMLSENESEMSNHDQERCETQRHIRFKPETRDTDQNHHTNEEYYHRMVAIEKRIGQGANVETELSDGEPQGSQNRMRFDDALKTSPCKSAEATHKSKTEEFYHRMVAMESKMWKEANIAGQAEAPHDVQRRVKFQDSVLKLTLSNMRIHQENTKNQLYDRMVQLETRIWIDGGDNEEWDTCYKSDDETSPTEANHFQSQN
ncbi:hypothetical protein BcDW1_8516 [Botrytis cinerea BcDW1]|uniref:Uncharacterized protein n=1 Tax=Botryotinia fuckeliana (strain BcDW1) TaxID=1290391 RepID=M7U889_BOTF1|nr:hypothetical protein BcDW1_8516 [Botrytis cinerea BcDW1]